MSYQVPQHIDKNKIFILNRSTIGRRLDPHYNKPVFTELWQSLSNQDYPLSSIRSNSLSIFSGITPKSGSDAYVQVDGIPFVRSGDFTETNEIDFSQLLFLKEDVHNTIMRNSQLKEGDLLIAIVGATIGKVGVYDYSTEANINQAICAVRLKKTLNSYYVQAFLQTNIGQKIIDRIKRPVARANINLEEVGSIPIPLLDISQQESIVKIMEEGRTALKQKEVEAQQLIDSIDSYLLEELDVFLPEINTDLKSRQFVINRSVLEGRFDPSVYKNGIKLVSQKYDNVKLSSCAWINPNTSFKGKDTETPISFIPMEVIDECYSEITSMSEKTIGETSGFTRFQDGDLLWAKITPCMQNGKSVVVRDLTNGLGCGSTEFFIIRPRTSQLSIDYLQALLHMKAIRKTAMLYFGGSAGQQRVSVNFLENFNVPLPPIEKQEEIAHHIAELRQKAKSLQQEGRLQLEKAKQEIEQMIIH